MGGNRNSLLLSNPPSVSNQRPPYLCLCNDCQPSGDVQSKGEFGAEYTNLLGELFVYYMDLFTYPMLLADYYTVRFSWLINVK